MGARGGREHRFAPPRVPAPGLRTRPPQCPCACSRRPPPRTIFRGRRVHTDGRPRGTAKPLLKTLSSVFQSLFRKIVGAQRSNGCLASFGNPGPHCVETPTKVRLQQLSVHRCTTSPPPVAQPRSHPSPGSRPSPAQTSPSSITSPRPQPSNPPPKPHLAPPRGSAQTPRSAASLLSVRTYSSEAPPTSPPRILHQPGARANLS